MSTFYFVGSGIASLAGAAFLIRDANVAGSDIVIFEESQDFGGALDAHGDAGLGYFMSGSRMFEERYVCTFGLMSSIPSASDPTISVTEETNRAKQRIPWKNHARLVDRHHAIVDAHPLGFSSRDRLALLELLRTPEHDLDDKQIRQLFAPEFFHTNFWFEWCTLFAFQQWHSAIEFKRYLLRFLHHFSTIDTQADVYRTKLNQYDSIAAPLVTWLRDRGVKVRFQTSVLDLSFTKDDDAITVDGVAYSGAHANAALAVASDDRVFVTLGSMTAAKTFGSIANVPAIDRSQENGSWKLWHTLAAGRTEFGNPAAFDSHIVESLWESFTVTMSDPEFFRAMERFSGSAAGQGGLITFKDSTWLLTISIFAQPFFANQPDGVFVWWGYGLFHDRVGDYVRKTMAECTGREILTEILGHLGFDAEREAMLDAANVTTCMMPYITSQFLTRKHGDRPDVIPKGSTNLAFIGQYCEVPDDVVFTVEYSIRSAQMAVYALLGLDRVPPPVYKGAHDPRVLVEALETMVR